MAEAATLASNAGTGAGSAVSWPGGKTAIVSEGTITAMDLEIQAPNGSWVVVVALDGDNFNVQDLPEGSYRLNVGTGSGVYSRMIGIDQV